jgi:hypothetical protein
VDSAQSPADAADGTEVADLDVYSSEEQDKALEDGVENNQKMAVTGFQFLVRVVQATSV